MKRTYISSKLSALNIKLSTPVAALFILCSCSDMLDMGNVDVMYADENHLTEGGDTVNSFLGIISQLQKVAVRTNLFGELRGDLVTVNEGAHRDLKEIADFAVTDDNGYNAPRDYYAVINNCNYYLANADTALCERHYGAQSSFDFYIFRAEWTAVRAIRAWTYLQLGQIYGSNIPLITDPILSVDSADFALSHAPKMDLRTLCDYFINDLKPYVAWFDYPYHGNPGHVGYKSGSSSRTSVLPIQLVLGDLYLWRASINRNPADAREAARCYYDYIDWVPTHGGVEMKSAYKVRNTTGTGSCAWQNGCLTSGEYSRGNATAYGNWFSTSSFGTASNEVIAAIAMEATSSKGYYNDLRKLYSYDTERENVEASISPSKVCTDYSDGGAYFDEYSVGSDVQLAVVAVEDLYDELRTNHYMGDLRLPTTLTVERRADHDVLSQYIAKCTEPEDIIVYRTGDVYLRLAEALNYAGFPKFALAILTTGLDELVIDNEVLAYCTNSADSAFVEYFDFSTNYYQTRVQSYAPYTAVRGMEYLMVPAMYDAAGVNQRGIHSRGSGIGLRTQLVMESGLYYPTATDVPADTKGYPVDATYCTDEEFKAFAQTQGIVEPRREDYATNNDYNDAVEQYKADYQAFFTKKRQEYVSECLEWYKTSGIPQVQDTQIAVVDSLIDVEQALETCFEGFRFGSLMRASYRKGDPSYLARKVAARDETLLGTLSNSDNWFISWNGQIGK